METALKNGDGVALVDVQGGEELIFSEHFACVYCGVSLPEIEPRTFSFNSPHGACPACAGLGFKLEVDPDLIIPNKELSLGEGAIIPWVRAGTSTGWYKSLIESVAKAYDFSTKVAVKDLPGWALDLLLHGNKGEAVTMRHKTHAGHVYSWETNFEGIIPNLERRHKETESDYMRSEIERYMAAQPCGPCEGRRLRPEALSVRVCDVGVMDVCALTIDNSLKWTQDISAEGAFIPS